VASYRDGAIYFLSDQGVKALKARDASNFGIVTDESLSIDRVLREALQAATPDVRAASIVTVEPESGRIWVVFDDTIYVLSTFPKNNIHAWSLYVPGFSITSLAVNNRRMYCRSGDTVYLYGGDDNATYDTSVVEILLPYITLQAPATFKRFHAIDVGCSSSWTIYVRIEPDTDSEELVAANYQGISYDQPTIAIGERTTHCSLRLVQEDAEPAVFSSVGLHYQLDEARG
jgi:hypothetical protein